MSSSKNPTKHDYGQFYIRSDALNRHYMKDCDLRLFPVKILQMPRKSVEAVKPLKIYSQNTTGIKKRKCISLLVFVSVFEAGSPVVFSPQEALEFFYCAFSHGRALDFWEQSG